MTAYAKTTIAIASACWGIGGGLVTHGMALRSDFNQAEADAKSGLMAIESHERPPPVATTTTTQLKNVTMDDLASTMLANIAPGAETTAPNRAFVTDPVLAGLPHGDDPVNSKEAMTWRKNSHKITLSHQSVTASTTIVIQRPDASVQRPAAPGPADDVPTAASEPRDTIEPASTASANSRFAP